MELLDDELILEAGRVGNTPVRQQTSVPVIQAAIEMTMPAAAPANHHAGPRHRLPRQCMRRCGD